MSWQNPLQISAIRPPANLQAKEPVRTGFFTAPRGLVRARVSSVLATKNPQWTMGAVVKWAYQGAEEIELYIEREELRLPLNKTCVFRSPALLEDSLVSFEIPFWIPDARITLWVQEFADQLDGDEFMAFSNPPQSITIEPIALTTVASVNGSSISYDANGVVLAEPNANRLSFTIWNKTDRELFVILGSGYDGFGSAISLLPNGRYESEGSPWTGRISGLFGGSGGSGDVKINEFLKAS